MTVRVEAMAEGEHPLCPHCGAKVTHLLEKPLQARSLFRVTYRYIHACPSCKKVLGTIQTFRA